MTAPVHDHPIMMWAARPLVMGYTAWVFNYGFPFQEREKDMAQMYAGNEELIRKYQVSYVVIDDSSRRSFQINNAYFANQPMVFEGPGRTIYDLRAVAQLPVK